MARQQAQLLLNMNSLEPVNFSVQQNNTEAFAVALCHLAELHAEQVPELPHNYMNANFMYCVPKFVECYILACFFPHLQGLYAVVSDIMKHLKQQFPPHTQHAKVSLLNKIQAYSRTDQQQLQLSICFSLSLSLSFFNSSGCCVI